MSTADCANDLRAQSVDGTASAQQKHPMAAGGPVGLTDRVPTVPRRVVTGHSADGVSVVVSDGPVPVSRELPGEGVAFHEVWNTTGAPAPLTAVEAIDPTERDLAVPPPPQGTKIRINEFEPGFLDDRGLQSPVHPTASVDYGSCSRVRSRWSSTAPR